MGLSGSSQKQTYTPSPQQAQAASTLAGVYGASAPNTQAIAGQLTGLVPGQVAAAGSTAQGVDAAANYNTQVLGGKYLSPSSNPYLASMMSQSDAAITNQVNGSFSAAGRTGSGANAYALAKGIGEANNSLLSSNYTAERANQQAAAAGAGTLNSGTLGSLLGLSTTASGLPMDAASQYATGIANLKLDGTTTKTDTPSVASDIGKAIQIGSVLFSDRRLKVDVERVGSDPDGLGRYTYRYVWGGSLQSGVMADEVAKLRPWALGPVIGGFATVDYGAL